MFTHLLTLIPLEFTDAIYPNAPLFLDNVLAEVTFHVRRLNHHPSLALWCGSNEIEFLIEEIGEIGAPITAYVELYEGLFLDTLLHAVWDQTRSVSYLPSSVSNGYLSLNHSAAVPMMQRYENLTSGSIYGDTGVWAHLTFSFSWLTYHMQIIMTMMLMPHSILALIRLDVSQSNLVSTASPATKLTPLPSPPPSSLSTAPRSLNATIITHSTHLPSFPATRAHHLHRTSPIYRFRVWAR